MKYLRFYIVVICVCVTSTIASQEICDCNYVTSGYYQDINNARLNLIKGNNDEAYKLLQSAENKCPMRNFNIYYEIEKYIYLLLQDNKVDKAIDYIKMLISQQGYSLNKFRNDDNFFKIESLTDWDSINFALTESEKHFVSDTILTMRFQRMRERDQYFRIEREKFYHADSADARLNNPYFEQFSFLIKSADDSNYCELMNIIDECGFPLSYKLNMSIRHRNVIERAIGLITVHIEDNSKLFEIIPIMLLNVANGNLHPSEYAFMIDHWCLIHNQPYIYGVYSTISNEQIYDFENLDKRRFSIGLESISMQNEINEYLQKLLQK